MKSKKELIERPVNICIIRPYFLYLKYKKKVSVAVSGSCRKPALSAPNASKAATF